MNRNIAAQKIALQRKIKALTNLKTELTRTSAQTERMMRGIVSQTRSFSQGVDMAAAIAAPIGLGFKQLFFKGTAKTAFVGVANADDALKSVVGRSWGFGVNPAKQGAVQGVAQNVLSGTGALEPKVSDGMLLALGKITAQSFIDITSPSFWAKKITGDPEKTVREILDQTRKNETDAKRAIDERIRASQQMLRQLNLGVDISSIA